MLRTTHFKQFTYLLYCNQIRNARTNTRKGTVFRKNLSSNPGIENRIKILKMESANHENLEPDNLNIDDMESDFMEAGNMHQQYERENREAARALSFAITKDKYFKSPKLPNLLMWSEKDQIRNLHQLDSNEWDPEKLSRCFPGSVHVIKKVLKSQWRPKDKSATNRHDRAVQRNWIALRQGKFNLENDLKFHLLSFSSRRHIFPNEDSLKNDKPIIIHNKQTKSSEFSDIINYKTSKRSLNDDDESSSINEKQIVVNIPDLTQFKVNTKLCDPKSDSFVLGNKSSKKQEMLPFKEFKEKLINSMSEDVEEDDLSMKYYDYLNKGNCEKGVQSSSLEECLPEIKEKSSVEKTLTKYKKGEPTDSLSLPQLNVFMKAENYKQKIRIPKEKIVSSAVYKVKDCFYDMDGKFLYRVPGMK